MLVLAEFGKYRQLTLSLAAVATAAMNLATGGDERDQVLPHFWQQFLMLKLHKCDAGICAVQM